MSPKVVVDGVIRAAGGVVVRGSDKREFLVVHRPHRSDWSFPKGHLDPGEPDEVAARREVLEETGVTAEIVADLGEQRYELPDGRPKGVRFFLMRAVEVGADSDGEVDEMRWLRSAEAGELLSYDTDRAALRLAQQAG